MGRALVLIAEGDPFSLRLLQELCEGAEMDVLTAGSGSMALSALARKRPNLIILDASLTADDGAEVLPIVRTDERLRAIPVLLTTEAEDEAAARAGIAAGATDLLCRPYRAFEVRQRIRMLLRLADAEAAAFGNSNSKDVSPSQISQPLPNAKPGLTARSDMSILLRYECTRALRYGHDLTCLLISLTPASTSSTLPWAARTSSSVGGHLMEEVSARLRGAIRASDHLCQAREEEFVILLPETRVDDAKAVIARIQNALQGPFDGDEANLRLDCQLGLAHLNLPDLGPDHDLLGWARAHLGPLSAVE